jgi:NAD(P)-dependent dehydrogenase (short-subunit alcohol dehydrogenase family)
LRSGEFGDEEVGQRANLRRTRASSGCYKIQTLDLKSRGIRVNVISPGPIKTPGLVELAGPDAGKQQGLLDYMASTVPLGRVGSPEEVAGAAVFLASSDASFIAATELFVDGGQAQI